MRDLWFSIYSIYDDYHGEEPPFANPQSFDWATDIKQHSLQIKQELEKFLESNKLQSYFNSSMVTKANSWKTISLKWWNLRISKHQKHFPFTTSLINKYPSIVSCSFNLLEPHSKILPHKGDTNAIYRCHMGLSIPAGLPGCGFKVKGETRSWQNNEWLVFMDAFEHEAWNDTNENRYILVVDVIRDEYKSYTQKVCNTVLSSLFLQKIGEKKRSLYKWPQRRVNFTANCLRPLAGLAVNVANALRLY